MFIKGTINLELDLDQVEEVIVKGLLADYGSLAKDVRDLIERSATLEDYEVKDLENNLEYMRAMDKVLSNYMLYHEHENFRRTWKEFVDLYEEEHP